MRARKLAAWITIAGLATVCGSSIAAQPDVKTYVLFGGSNIDSTENASIWFPVGGAARVVIRTWTTKAAFHASTDADSTFTDSIAVFKVAFSDSVLGTSPVLFCGDSTVITTATVTNIDSTTKLVAVVHPPLHEALRANGNGSGTITEILPMNPGLATADGIQGFIPPQYARVLVTPRRRLTVTGGQSTAGKSVNGLKGLRMVAKVYFTFR